MSVLKEKIKRVLIVDDEPEMLQILAIRVKSFGEFDIELASDGFEAAKKIARNDYDLILLDVMMPRVDGIQVCKALRANPRTVDVPVIMISAAQTFDTVVECTKAGANDYIIKPFDGALLKEKIIKFLRLPTEEKIIDETVKNKIQPIQNIPLKQVGFEITLLTKKITDLISKSISFPIIPETLLNLSRCLKTKSSDIKDMLSLDIGYSVDLLLVANSVFYSADQNITSIKSAVTVIGEEAIKKNVDQMVRTNNVLDKSVWYSLYSGFFAEYVSRAYLAKTIAENENYHNPDEAYTIALLKDIGRYFLLNNFHEEYDQIIQEAPLSPKSLSELEKSGLGITNDKITDMLVHHISLPLIFKTFFSSANMSANENFNIKKLREILELADYLKQIIGYNYGDRRRFPKVPKNLPVKYTKFIDYAKEVMCYATEEVNSCCEKFAFHDSIVNYPKFIHRRVLILAKKIYYINSSQITLKIFLEYLGFEVFCDTWDKLNNLDNMKFDILILDIAGMRLNETYKMSAVNCNHPGLVIYENKHIYGKLKRNFPNLIPKINIIFHDDLLNEINEIVS